MLKKGPALAVLVALSVITVALIGTTLWRQFQFAEFLEADWMGLLALCAAQLGIYGFPAAWGYLGSYRSHEGSVIDAAETASAAFIGGGVANLVFAVITAAVQFGPSFAAVTYIALPVLASAAMALTVYLLAGYRPDVGIRF